MAFFRSAPQWFAFGFIQGFLLGPNFRRHAQLVNENALSEQNADALMKGFGAVLLVAGGSFLAAVPNCQCVSFAFGYALGFVISLRASREELGPIKRRRPT